MGGYTVLYMYCRHHCCTVYLFAVSADGALHIHIDCTGALIEYSNLRFVVEQPCHLWGRQWGKWAERMKTMRQSRTGHREVGRKYSELIAKHVKSSHSCG